MGSIDTFVAEDSIDGEIPRRMWVRGKLMEHVGRNGGGVGSEDEFEGFIFSVRVAVAYRAIFARFVNLFHVFEIFVVVSFRLFR